ncbi:MAG TPA: hypothetical protein VJT82_11855 [Pyrinomonadaceae bacterium]|nr:hypothetical protein [Pyrinomonadaceae bacterium]
MDEPRAGENAAVTAASQAENPIRTPQSSLVEEAARVAATLNDKLPPSALESSANNSGNHRGATGATHEPRAHDAPTTQTATDGDATVSAAATPAQAESRGRMRQRAASVGASVGENLRPRVEKLREASIVVFDEASDDPGLRFVLVAVALFVVFLLFLLFSYILG